MKKIIILINFVLLAFVLVSCSYINELLPKYEVRFMKENEILQKEEVTRNTLIDEPSNVKLEEGYYINGWFKDLNDDNSEWDFSKDLVTSDLILYANVLLKDDYLVVENIKLKGDYLIWDEISDANYKVNDKTVSENKFNLNDLNLTPLKETEVLINVLKEGFNSIESNVLITYYPEEKVETENIDFEAFDFNDFKELNRSTFKSSLIDLDDFHLYVNEGRLTNKNEKPKSGEVALILREKGYVEILRETNNFKELSFDLATYQNRENNGSKLNVYATNDLNEDYQLIKSIEPNENDFTKVIIKDENIVDDFLLDEIYFKFEIDKANVNLILDNIVIKEMFDSYYGLKNLNNAGVELSEYYQSATNLKGEKLVNELRFIVSSNLNPVTYKDIKEIVEFSDINPNNKNEVIGIYDRVNHKANWGQRSDWHREHVWPNSRLGMDRVKENEVNQGSDPHNLRAITPSTNSSRSNRYFDNKTDKENLLGHTLPNLRYYPGDLDIGDVSRILMYMVIRYDFLGLTDNTDILARKAYTKEAAFMGKLSVLLDWHELDPVDEFEIYRNEVIFEYQNNRNPFIDHPELFEEVFNYYKQMDEKREINLEDIHIYVDYYFINRKEIII